MKPKKVWVLTGNCDGEAEVFCAWDHKPTRREVAKFWEDDAAEMSEQLGCGSQPVTAGEAKSMHDDVELVGVATR